MMFLAHPLFHDVFFKVLSINRRTERVIEVTIEWYNRGAMGSPFSTNVIENKVFTLDKWSEFYQVYI